MTTPDPTTTIRARMTREDLLTSGEPQFPCVKCGYPVLPRAMPRSDTNVQCVSCKAWQHNQFCKTDEPAPPPFVKPPMQVSGSTAAVFEGRVYHCPCPTCGKVWEIPVGERGPAMGAYRLCACGVKWAEVTMIHWPASTQILDQAVLARYFDPRAPR